MATVAVGIKAAISCYCSCSSCILFVEIIVCNNDFSRSNYWEHHFVQGSVDTDYVAAECPLCIVAAFSVVVDALDTVSRPELVVSE